MKEDAQLICPIAYDDPGKVWDEIQNEIVDRLPLRDVTWRHPVSATFVTIPKLPLRFLPSSANLFKDTNHPFRWFLAPYVNIYFISMDSLEAYKALKPSIKQWVDAHTLKRTFWLIVFTPRNHVKADIQSKLLSRLSSDFYSEKIGDRTVQIAIETANIPASSRFQQGSSSVNDFLSKLREGITYSFQLRLSVYDIDIRRLDSLRGSPLLEFRQLFLVKESLALMYQMHQLLGEALVQYEELEALLPFAPQGVLPEPEWPWSYVDYKPPLSSNRSDGASTNDTPGSVKSTLEQTIDGWIGCCRNGDDVLLYSMNNMRMKILKNKVSLWELQRYVFSKEVFLLTQLKQIVLCSERGLMFINLMRNSLEKSLSRYGTESDENYLIKSQQADVWTISASIKIVRGCLDALKKIQGKTINSDSLSGKYNDKRVNAIWDDQTLPCLSHLSELLRLAAYKLMNLFGGGEEYREMIQLAVSCFSCWEDWTDKLKKSFPFLALCETMAIQLEEINVGILGKPSMDEILAQSSKKLRHIAINCSYYEEKRKKLRSTNEFQVSDLSEGIGTSPSLSSSNWFENYKQNRESDSLKSREDDDKIIKVWKEEEDTNSLQTINDGRQLTENTNYPLNFFYQNNNEIIVEIFTVLCEMDLLLNRRRLSFQEKIQSAEISFSAGKIHRAMELFCDALDLLTYQFNSNEIKSAESSPSKNYESKSFIYRIKNSFLHEDCSTDWLEIKYWTIRKMLLVSRILNDRVSFLLIALELLKSKYQSVHKSIEMDKLWNNIHGIGSLFSPDVNNHCNNSQLIDESFSIRLDFDSYFKIDASFARTINCTTGCTIRTEDYKIADVNVPLLVAKFSVGKAEPLIISVEIESLLSEPIDVDNSQIVFKPFKLEVEVLRNSLQPPTSTSTIPSPIFPDAKDSIIGKLVNVETLTEIERITILPGKQVVSFLIIPSSVGEFSLSSISMQMGSWIKFESDISTPLALRERKQDFIAFSEISKRLNIFRKEILRVIVNENPLQTLITTSSLTPLGQVDVFELRLSTGPEDIASNFSFEVYRPQSHADEATMTGERTKQLSAAVGISFESPENWQVIEISNSMTRRYKCPSSLMGINKGKQIKAMSGLALKASTQYIFKIPYLTSSADIKIGEVHSISLSCVLSGDLFRCGCKIPLFQSLQTVITTGIAIDVTSWTSHMTSNHHLIEASRQFRIKNVCSIPIDLVAYRLSITTNSAKLNNLQITDGPIDLELLPEPTDHAEKESLKLPLLFVSILPNEEFYVAFRIQYKANAISSAESLMKEFESFNLSFVKFLYRRQSLEQAYTGNKDSVGETVMFQAKAPLVEAWFDFSTYTPKLEFNIHASALVSSPVLVLGISVPVNYKIKITNPHVNSVHTSQNMNLLVSSIASLNWLVVGKSKFNVTLNYPYDCNSYSFEVSLIPLTIGKVMLPSLSINYFYGDSMDRDDGVVDVFPPSCEELTVIPPSNSLAITKSNDLDSSSIIAMTARMLKIDEQ